MHLSLIIRLLLFEWLDENWSMHGLLKAHLLLLVFFLYRMAEESTDTVCEGTMLNNIEFLDSCLFMLFFLIVGGFE